MGGHRGRFGIMRNCWRCRIVDGVIISTADFQHAPLLKLAAEAGKDVYCEKPMANVLTEAKAAREAVRARKVVVQIGTQHRSEPYQIAAKEQIVARRAGACEQGGDCLELPRPALAGAAGSEAIREEDTDWKRWLLTKPYRPFDPRLTSSSGCTRIFRAGFRISG